MMGRWPMLTIDFGIVSEYSRSRVPKPPQNRTTFIPLSLRGPRAAGVGLHGARAVPLDRLAEPRLQRGAGPPPQERGRGLEVRDADVAVGPVGQGAEARADRR